LQGMAINLPPPLRKAPPAMRPLRVQVRDQGRVKLTYGAARVGMTFADKQLQRAIVRLGDTPLADAPAGNGLWLAGNIDTLPLQAWFETLQQLRKPATTKDTDKHGDLPLLGANLAIANLRLGRRQI